MNKLHSIECPNDPSQAPEMVNQHWTNTSTGKQWFSKGTNSIADWVLYGGDTDEKVAIDGANTPGNLFSLLEQGSNVVLEKTGNAPNQKIKISVEQNGATDFGDCFKRASSNSVALTTGNKFQQKLNLTTDSLPEALYRIGWTFQWNMSSTSADVVCQLQLGNNQVLAVHQQEPKDGNGDQQHTVSSFIYLNLSGVKSFDLDFKRSAGNGSGTVRIWNARLEFWKVGPVDPNDDAGSIHTASTNSSDENANVNVNI